MQSVPTKCWRPISIVTKGHIHPANAARECLHRNPGSLLFPGPGKQLVWLLRAKPPLAFPHTTQIAASPRARLVGSTEVLFPRRGAPSDIPNTASRGAGQRAPALGTTAASHLITVLGAAGLVNHLLAGVPELHNR